jgi:uncharacterized protein
MSGPAPVPITEPISPLSDRGSTESLLPYLLLGTIFGFVLVRGEVVSWFRIQEMFRFQSIHMYGVFATALAFATPLLAWLQRSGARALSGEPIAVPGKVLGKGYRYALGGGVFGVGWALIGACPGPIFALIGAGVGAMVAALASALAGTWVYGMLRNRLPH